MNVQLCESRSYHLFEGILQGSNHQAFMLDLLLGVKAWRRGAGGAWGPCGSPEGGCAREGPVRPRRRVVIWLLSQACGRQAGEVAQHVQHILQLLHDVMLQQPGGNHGCPGTRMSIKQRPVVKHQSLSVLNINTHTQTQTQHTVNHWGDLQS